MNPAENRDPIADACQRAGQRLGDVAYREHGSNASETTLFNLERMVHPPSEAFLRHLGATDDQILLAKIMIGHALRSRYASLVLAAPRVQKMSEARSD